MPRDAHPPARVPSPLRPSSRPYPHLELWIARCRPSDVCCVAFAAGAWGLAACRCQSRAHTLHARTHSAPKPNLVSYHGTRVAGADGRRLDKLGMIVPRVVRELTSTRVLVTEWIDGVPPRELGVYERQGAHHQ